MTFKETKVYNRISEILKKRFPAESILGANHSIMVDSGYFLGDKCGYALILYRDSKEGLLYPHHLSYDPQNKRIDVYRKDNHRAWLLSQYEHIKYPSIEQINKVCDRVLSDIKRAKEQLKLISISKDF
jgi:hypothetical protein